MKKPLSRFLATTRWKPLSLALCVLGVLLFGFLLGRNQSIAWKSTPGDSISARQLTSMLSKKSLPNGTQKFTLINVHTPYEGEIGQTDAFIAFDKVIEQSSFLPQDKNTPIILYCKTGRMSTEALVTVRKLGYTNVRHLTGGMDAWQTSGGKLLDLSKLEETVLPKDGFTLPVSWGTLGKRLSDAGVINLPAFKKVVTMTPDQEKILTEGSGENITINATNSQFVVDVLWALGLAQKSIVYTDGPLGKQYVNEQGNFASTGGWNLARGPAVSYLNSLDLIPLTAEQQSAVGTIAKTVYRPCCGNSTWFPDCNHGMAALALIELLVSARIPENEIYRAVLGFNSFWFPDNYLSIATYFARRGTPWDAVDAKTVLGEQFSSSKGAGDIYQKVGPLPYRPATGGGCGA